MSDSQELQDILEKAAERPEKGRSLASTVTEILADEQDNSSKAPADYTQWIVLPNGTYAATGPTAPHLPVGAYTLEMTDAGLFFVAKKILTDTLIDLGNSNSLRVIEGIKLFWERKQKFIDRGLIFKRGILMWGPPGSGKTATLSLLIADLISKGGIVLLVQNPALAVSALRKLRKIEPTRPLIIVLEDVEEIINAFGEHDLLALLDGEHQTDNVVCIATTNYPEMLGPRIVNRPSRFDDVVKIGMPSSHMRELYIKHVLSNDIENFSIDISKWVSDTEGMSIAHLKELVIAVTCLDQKYDNVMTRLKTMKTPPRSSGYGEGELGFTKVAGNISVAAQNRPR